MNMNSLIGDSYTNSSPAISIRESITGEDSNISLPQSEFNNSTIIETDKRTRRTELTKSRQSNRIIATHTDIIVTDLHEYRWPPDDTEGHVPCRGNDKELADWFVLQEVVSSLLQIKSFKRKYPDLYRRSVDGWEKDWLAKKNMLPKGIGDLGLTALRSDEVLNLLEHDYPDMHGHVFRLFHERKLQLLADQQREQYQDIICQTSKVERGSKLDMMRKKSLRSAAEYNKSLNQDRRKERLFYWDLQTMQIHVTHNKRSFMSAFTDVSKEHSDSVVKEISMNINDYPVAVIPGQYSSRFKNYTNDELGYFPVNTCIYSLPKVERLKDYNNPPESNSNNRNELNNHHQQQSLSQPGTPKPVTGSTSFGSSGTLCSVCRVRLENPIKCFECGKSGHPSCMDIKDDMICAVRSYNWSCMDCKKCHKCGRSSDEDQMMFCDKCDRGYHAYCVGLSGIPDGSWECSICAN